MGGSYVDRPKTYQQKLGLRYFVWKQVTLATYLEKGIPPSREKAHNIREAVATMLTPPNICVMTIILAYSLSVKGNHLQSFTKKLSDYHVTSSRIV